MHGVRMWQRAVVHNLHPKPGAWMHTDSKSSSAIGTRLDSGAHPLGKS